MARLIGFFLALDNCKEALSLFDRLSESSSHEGDNENRKKPSSYDDVIASIEAELYRDDVQDNEKVTSESKIDFGYVGQVVDDFMKAAPSECTSILNERQS